MNKFKTVFISQKNLLNKIYSYISPNLTNYSIISQISNYEDYVVDTPSDLDRGAKRQQIQDSPKSLSNVSIHFLHITVSIHIDNLILTNFQILKKFMSNSFGTNIISFVQIFFQNSSSFQCGIWHIFNKGNRISFSPKFHQLNSIYLYYGHIISLVIHLLAITQPFNMTNNDHLTSTSL